MEFLQFLVNRRGRESYKTSTWNMKHLPYLADTKKIWLKGLPSVSNFSLSFFLSYVKWSLADEERSPSVNRRPLISRENHNRTNVFSVCLKEPVPMSLEIKTSLDRACVGHARSQSSWINHLLWLSVAIARAKHVLVYDTTEDFVRIKRRVFTHANLDTVLLQNE